MKVIAVACAVTVAAGCGGSKSANDPAGGSFAAVSVVRPDGTSPSIAEFEDIRLQFSEKGGGAGWTAGCNEYSGRWSKTEIEPTGGTEVACNHGMQAEAWFEGFMGELPKWRFDGSTLTLRTGRAVVELEPAGNSE